MKCPSKPELAQSFGYTKSNRSPIGLLYKAYQSIKQPGSKELVFVKENGDTDQVTPKNWANKFYEGDPEYQDDTKWWEAVTKADLRDGASTFNPLNPLNKT